MKKGEPVIEDCDRLEWLAGNDVILRNLSDEVRRRFSITLLDSPFATYYGETFHSAVDAAMLAPKPSAAV